MKKIGDIMAEMGFRKDAPDSVKEAFIKHLIKSSTGVDVETPSEKREPKTSENKNANNELKFDLRPGPAHQAPTQLSFNFDQDQGRPKQKVS